MIRLILSLIFCSTLMLNGQPNKNQPKLVVGIVIDQMRYDYLMRYYNKFSAGGFKRLLAEGYSCKNTHYNYVPTYTAPGHASIFTGTTPSVHGIIANTWFDKTSGKMHYCTSDNSVKSVGGAGYVGQHSPRAMLASSVLDEIKHRSFGKAKTIGIALKDRGAILPAGHSANAAYWYDGATGGWITSSFYMNDLPQWVKSFNEKQLPKKYLSKPWTTLRPISEYTESISDSNKYESLFIGEKASVFPHDLPSLMAQNKNLDLIRTTPFGNTLTKDFAIDAIRSENLGKGNFTDAITISFSSPDYIGHEYGPSSVEMQDTYLRLDLELAELLTFLDSWAGKKGYLLFLTADHAAAEVPSLLQDLKQPAGYFNKDVFADSLNRFCLRMYGDTIYQNWSNFQVFLNHKKIAARKLKLSNVRKEVANYILSFPGINGVVTADALLNTQFVSGFQSLVQKGFHQVRSGDIMVNLHPNWVEYGLTGTTHGSAFVYDTHVPLIFFGAGITSGSTNDRVEIIDIAPTVSTLMNVALPAGSTGQLIRGVVK